MTCAEQFVLSLASYGVLHGVYMVLFWLLSF